VRDKTIKPDSRIKPSPAVNEAISVDLVHKDGSYSAQVEGGWIRREAEEDLIVVTDRNSHSIFVPLSKLSTFIRKTRTK
jgi:hypothetical protein